MALASSSVEFEATCPICLEPFKHAVTTSCGHTFCAKCALDVWDKGGHNRQLDCPIDRRPVAMLIPNYLLRSAPLDRTVGAGVPVTAADAAELDRSIARYNAQFSDAPRSAGDRIRDARVLGRNLFAQSPLFKVLVVVSVVVAVGYFLLPRDLIPDDWGIFGLVDDFGVALLMFWLVFAYVEAYRSRLITQVETRNHP